MLKLLCPFCKNGILELVKANEPWSSEHYQCSECNSTYCKEEIERGVSVPVPTNIKEIKCHDL